MCQCMWLNLEGKLVTYASGAISWLNLQPMQVAPSGGQLCNKTLCLLHTLSTLSPLFSNFVNRFFRVACPCLKRRKRDFNRMKEGNVFYKKKMEMKKKKVTIQDSGEMFWEILPKVGTRNTISKYSGGGKKSLNTEEILKRMGRNMRIKMWRDDTSERKSWSERENDASSDLCRSHLPHRYHSVSKT